jgi:hypothetical protein
MARNGGSISQLAVTLHRVAAFCSPLFEITSVLVPQSRCQLHRKRESPHHVSGSETSRCPCTGGTTRSDQRAFRSRVA